MKQLTNITAEPQQRHIVVVEEKNVIITLKFHPAIQAWTFDIEYDDQNKYGLKLALGVLHLNSNNWPFDISIIDTFQTGLDPFKIDDFSTGRIEMFIIEPDELTALRGYSVQV